MSPPRSRFSTGPEKATEGGGDTDEIGRNLRSHRSARSMVSLVEQARHRLFGRGAPDGFADQGGDGEGADIAGDLDRLGGLNGVGDDQLLELRRGDAGPGAAGRPAAGF